MADCFCGCGRDVSGIRRRASNVVGGEMSEQLMIIEAAIGDAPPAEATRGRDLAAEGRRLLADITALVHETRERKDVDKRAPVAWLKEAKAFAPDLVAASGNLPWRPEGGDTNLIAASGTRATGTVARAQMKRGNEFRHRIELSVRLDDPAGQLLEQTVSVVVSAVPREGDRVEVAYDPDDTSRFVFRALSSPPAGDRVADLTELARLHEQGLLTREEFETEKARLLGH